MTTKILPFFVLLFIQTYSISQNTNIQLDETIENILEEYISSSETENDHFSIIDKFHFYLSNPLHINSCTREELEDIPILNEVQINNFLNYRNTYGTIYSLYELRAVRGFTKKEAMLLSYFFTVNKRQYVKKDISLKKSLTGKHKLFLRTHWQIEDSQGEILRRNQADSANAFIGNKIKQYVRYEYIAKKHLRLGYTAEKDPGEQALFKDQMLGFDYNSAYLQIDNIGPVKKIMVGDFEFQTGQGLVCWSNHSITKSSYVLNINKNARGLKKYSSTDENSFFRGIGIESAYRNFSITGFYSNKPIDAAIDDNYPDSSSCLSFSSFLTTGYHRSIKELRKKKTVRKSTLGGRLNFKKDNLRIGASFLQNSFNIPYIPKEKPYNHYYFTGDKNIVLGVDYKANINGCLFFGEAAISQNLGKATINGLVYSPIQRISFAILYRHFMHSFQSLQCNAFLDNSSGNNESGLYWGVDLFPIKYWKLSAYADIFENSRIKYRINKPSNGKDFFVLAEYFPSESLQVYLKIKNKEKYLNESTEKTGVISKTYKYVKNGIRLNITYALSDNLRLKSRLEFSNYKYGNHPANRGLLILQDISYQMKNIPAKIRTRLAIFDTDNWDSRIYAYENDVLYAYTIPAYFSKGLRSYLNLKYELSHQMHLWFRYSNTSYIDKFESGSGNDYRSGNKKTEIKIQLLYKF